LGIEEEAAGVAAAAGAGAAAGYKKKKLEKRKYVSTFGTILANSRRRRNRIGPLFDLSAAWFSLPFFGSFH